MQEKVAHVNDQMQALRQEQARQRAQVEASGRQLVSMERSSGPNQQATMFLPQAESLLQLIHVNVHRFKCAPIGPVGAHLSLVDDRCAPHAFGCLPHLLCSGTWHRWSYLLL